jgi:uncharacterized membrane protein
MLSFIARPSVWIPFLMVVICITFVVLFPPEVVVRVIEFLAVWFVVQTIYKVHRFLWDGDGHPPY